MSNCLQCGEALVQPKYRTIKFCSRKCSAAHYSENRSVDIDCLGCGTRFTVRKSESDRVYCTRECYSKHSAENPDTIIRTAQTKICEICQKEFAPGSNTSRRRFCSTACSNRARRTLPDIACKVCGKTFTSKSHEAKYCSRECYFADGVQGRPPGETTTFVCVGCGKNHTVPKNYPSKKLYCSNKCAKKEQKKGWSKRGAELDDGSLLIFRSDYETRFYALCLRFDVPCRNYDGPDIQTSVGTYRPDFIIELSGEEHIVEVKGYVTPESAIKTQEASEQIENFMLVLRERLLRLEQSGF